MDKYGSREHLVDQDQLSSVVVEETLNLEIAPKDESENTYKISWGTWTAITVFFVVPAVFFLIFLSIKHHPYYTDPANTGTSDPMREYPPPATNVSSRGAGY